MRSVQGDVVGNTSDRLIGLIHILYACVRLIRCNSCGWCTLATFVVLLFLVSSLSCLQQDVTSLITWTKCPKNSVCHLTCNYSRNTVPFTSFWTLLKMEGTRNFETPVTIYQSTRRCIPYSYIDSAGTVSGLANNHVFNICQMWWREAKVGTRSAFLSLYCSSYGIVLGLHFVRWGAYVMWKIMAHKCIVCRRKCCAGYTGWFWNKWPRFTYLLFGPKRRNLIQTCVIWSFVFAVWPL